MTSYRSRAHGMMGYNSDSVAARLPLLILAILFHFTHQQNAITLTQRTSLIRTAPEVIFVNDSSVTLSFTLELLGSLSTLASKFQVEISNGWFSEEFELYDIFSAAIPDQFSNTSFSTSYTVADLQPYSNYSFRVSPIFPTVGLGYPSPKAIATTLAPSINYWEPIVYRRLSLAATGRGFTNPVLDRPHLDTGVEVHGERASENPLRHSDPTTSETPVFPSGRRGHTLSSIGEFVYMFGGRTNGYSCASVYLDTTNLGTTTSGRYVYPCTHKQAEVDELWSFDISTYRWNFVNTSKWESPPPPPRELHISAVVEGDLYVFGGKSRFFPLTDSDTGEPVLLTGDPVTGAKQPHFEDKVYNDLWRLSVEKAEPYFLKWPSADVVGTAATLAALAQNGVVGIPQGARLLATLRGEGNATVRAVSDPISPRASRCVDKVAVKVTLTHPCINQLRLTLMGPGPTLGSPNFFPSADTHEVVLFNQIETNGTGGCAGGTHSFVFDDGSSRLPETCCTNTFEGVYRPQGRLSEYIGATMAANWTLVVTDVKEDDIVGTLDTWEIDFVASPCFRKYTWTNVSSLVGPEASSETTPPENRYLAQGIAYKEFLFIYGGRDAADSPLQDLHRFDTRTLEWTQLSPSRFFDSEGTALHTSSSVGSNFMLTVWGLIRFGGYYRQSTMTAQRVTFEGAYEYDNYDNGVYVMDPVTLRWREVEVETIDQFSPAVVQNQKMLLTDTFFGRGKPSPRYFSAASFISSKLLPWKQQGAGHRALYDKPIRSSRANYQGSLSDSVLVFGGFDGSTGGVFDGSSGGLQNDAWMLRLSNWSTEGTRFSQQRYLESNCAWRQRASNSGPAFGTLDCLGGAGSSCEFRDLLMLAWCTAYNQSVA